MATEATRVPAAKTWARGRLPYLDNIKVILIAAIIAMHAVLGYAGSLEVWSYGGVREVTLSPAVEVVLLVAITPFGLFVIALLFLVAGLLTRQSVERKGTARFVRDRLLRLGLPFAVYALLIQPAVMYALEHPLGDAPGSYWYEFLGAERQIDTGPLWFVGVLLIFSLVYAGWVAVRPHTGSSSQDTQITARQLLMIVAAVAPFSFLVRLVYPYGSDSGFTDLNFWEWPACIALFVLGVAGFGRGWLLAVPGRLIRQSRHTALVAVLAMAAWLTVTGSLELVDESMGGWHWTGLVFVSIEGILAVFGSVWLLGTAQRHLNRPLRWVGPAAKRSAYGAFILQTPVLIGLAVALRPLPLPAEVKAAVVAIGGVAISFGLAAALIRRLPLVARIL
jgi:hypothetical protein